MSRVRNSNEFVARLHDCFRQAARIPTFASETVSSAGSVVDKVVFQTKEELLEYHAREYTIDHILEALNWSLSPPQDADEYRLQNMAPEVSLESASRKT